MKSVFFYPLAPLLGFALAFLTPSRPVGSPATGHQPPPKPASLARPLPALAADADAQAALRQWAEHDPSGLCQWLIERGVPPYDEALVSLFTTWVKQDIDAAFTAAFNLPGDFQREKSVLWKMLNAARDSPDGLAAAWRWIPLVEEQVSVFGGGSDTWIDLGDPRPQAELLAASSGKLYSGALVNQFAKAWATQDRAAVMEWMQTLRPELRSAAAGGLIDAWTDQDVQGALDYLATTAGTGERFYVFKPLIQLASTDPQGALEWQEENLGISNDNATRNIFSRWKSQSGSWKEALEYILNVEDPTLRHDYFGSWAHNADTPTLVQTLQSLQPGAERTALFKKTALHAGPGEDMSLWRSFLADPAQSDVPAEVASIAAMSYAYQDPLVALNWSMALPERLRGQSIDAVIDVWKRRDPVAAAQAVEALPAGPVKDAALRQLQPKRNPFE